MKLDTYLRTVVSQNMFKYINLCKCEKCGNTINLEIHHKKLYFFEMVDKSLDDLGFPHYQDTEQYSDFELDKISVYLLGLHLKSEYSILCSDCHTSLHKENVKRRHRKIDDIDVESVLNYLHQLEGTFIYSEDRTILGRLLNTRYVGIESINTMLDEIFGQDYQYRLHNKDEDGKRYSDKRRKLEDGTDNKNRGKTYWILRK